MTRQHHIKHLLEMIDRRIDKTDDLSKIVRDYNWFDYIDECFRQDQVLIESGDRVIVAQYSKRIFKIFARLNGYIDRMVSHGARSNSPLIGAIMMIVGCMVYCMVYIVLGRCLYKSPKIKLQELQNMMLLR